MPRNKNENDTTLILILSGAITLGVTPFVFIRVAEQQWHMVALDAAAMLLTFSTFVYVWVTGKTEFARWAITILCVIVMTITVHLRGYDNFIWVYPSLTATFFLLPPKYAVPVSLAFLANVMRIVWPELNTVDVAKALVTSISMMVFCYAFASRTLRQQQELTQLAILDPLTGVGNRRALEEKLLDLTGRLHRYPTLTATLIMIDLDKFKLINDEHGHAAGDTVLTNFVNISKKRIRSTDFIYRYGGEEFVVIAENTNAVEGLQLAEGLRQAVEKNPLIDAKKLTLSAGVAEYDKGESSYRWLERADEALYKAKESGRNVCCVA